MTVGSSPRSTSDNLNGFNSLNVLDSISGSLQNFLGKLLRRSFLPRKRGRMKTRTPTTFHLNYCTSKRVARSDTLLKALGCTILRL